MSNCNYTTTGGQCGQNTQNTCGCQQNGAAAEDAACNCRDAFATALRLLCQSELAGLINFGAFAFVGDSFVIGSNITCPCGQTGTYDNLADTLTGSFNRFTPCSCDLLDISGTVYDTTPQADPDGLPTLLTELATALGATAGVDQVTTALQALSAQLDPDDPTFNEALQAAFLPFLGGCSCPQLAVDEVSLCSLDAIAFEAAGATEPVRESNFQTLRQLLSQILNPKCPPPCPPCTPPKPQPCTVPANCRNEGILASLDRCGMVRSLSLTAGPLLLVDVSLLGAVGDVMVLANDADERIYFVCSDHVEFAG